MSQRTSSRAIVAIWKMDRRTAAGPDLPAVVTAGQIGEQTVRARLERHAGEARQSILPAEQRRVAVDADTKTSGALIAEEPQDLRIDLHVVEEKVLVAHFRQPNFLFRR